jgi:tRNA-splicing ligase RtcB
MGKNKKTLNKDGIPIRQVEEAIWEIPKEHRKKMRTSVRIVGTEELVRSIEVGALKQIINVATLPGIVNYAWMMPDTHIGYGMPVGGVAAFDPKNGGVISPGAIGFDINCGMRLISTNLAFDQIKSYIPRLVNELFKAIPAGVGKRGFIKLKPSQLEEIIVDGAQWMIKKGYGWEEDKKYMEEHGKLAGADPFAVSDYAARRGVEQIATLGSGNHYLEIQKVEKIFDKEIAKKMMVFDKDQIVIMIHSGSRGFGHQNCSDYLRKFDKKMLKFGISIPDKNLACLPFESRLGKKYYAAMAASVNFAFANRQGITHKTREVFSKVLNKSAKNLGMYLVYDVAHNTAKIEDGLIVHRKGATRSFGPGEAELPQNYQNIGQPVIIGGSMETGSYLLVGTRSAKSTTFGSTAHGSGRTMSRTKAKKIMRGRQLAKKMQKEGIFVRSASWSGLAEEGSYAYKDINTVVKSVNLAGISKPVAKFKPIGNIKG